ncbi:unnamed protein product [Brassica oleracea var. botrytis]
MQCFYFLYCLFTYYIFFPYITNLLIIYFLFLNNNVTCHFLGELFSLMWTLYGASKGLFY